MRLHEKQSFAFLTATSERVILPLRTAPTASVTRQRQDPPFKNRVKTYSSREDVSCRSHSTQTSTPTSRSGSDARKTHPSAMNASATSSEAAHYSRSSATSSFR